MHVRARTDAGADRVDGRAQLAGNRLDNQADGKAIDLEQSR